MKTAYEVIDEFDLIGVPFQWCGRDHKKSLDCYGLVKFIHNKQGRFLPEYSTPSNPYETKEFVLSMSGQREHWIPTTKLEEGMVVIFRTMRYLHVGYLLGDGKFVHTWEASGGVCIEDVADWQNRIEAIYEFVSN